MRVAIYFFLSFLKNVGHPFCNQLYLPLDECLVLTSSVILPEMIALLPLVDNLVDVSPFRPFANWTRSEMIYATEMYHQRWSRGTDMCCNKSNWRTTGAFATSVFYTYSTHQRHKLLAMQLRTRTCFL